MDALVAHRKRIMYRVAIVGAICLLPFAVNNFLDGRHAIGAAVMAVVLTLGIDALAIHLEKRPPIPFVVLLGVTTWMVERYIGQGVAIRFFASLTLTIVIVNIIRTIIRELQARLLDLAITDPLTGAFNRRHMASCLGDAVERHRRTGAPASVLLIDVDHFKRINDRLGHEAGDGVL